MNQDEYVTAILELQYLAIQELVEKTGVFPSREEVIEEMEASMEESSIEKPRLTIVKERD